ncbi:MAG: methionyl-tRNA formyltransferase [Gammaproteobacteria bacterium]
MRTVFAGTPEFAVPSLEALIAHPAVDLAGIYTQPDRPAGRGRRLTASPVKRAALAAGLDLYQPATLRGDEVCAQFAALTPALLVVAAYGLILPASFLDVPRYAINVHASLLPRWRGAAPIQRAILAGDKQTGISIMRIVQRLDAGPVWLQRSCTIDAHETGGTLHDKLAALGAEALCAALDMLNAERIEEQVQDESAVTYADKISAADRDIDWSAPAPAIERQVRALAPSPGARCRLGRIEVKVLASVVDTTLPPSTPGSIVAKDGGGIGVACGSGALRLTELQPGGKQRMNAAAFLNGYGEQL